jgi:ribonuclease HI
MKSELNYVAYCDGGSRGNPGPAASAFVLFLDNELVASEGKYIGEDTNNVAEWVSLILALEEIKKSEFYPVTIKMDSLLVVSQVQDLWKVKTPHLLPYYKKAKTLLHPSIKIEHVRREFNKEADALVNLTLDSHK